MALEYGKAFVHEQIVYQVGNIPFITLKSLRYKEARIKDFNYGTQIDPHSYGTGNRMPVEGTFQINFTEHLALKDGQPDGDVTNILPFDIPITYANSQAPRLETLKNVLILDAEPSSETGNTDILVTYTFKASKVTSKGL
jgi:hypothetical protein